MIEFHRQWPVTVGQRQQGLSLVELLIAMALSLIIVAAIAQLFAGMSRSNQEMAKTSSQIENARFSMQFITNDLVHAGYWDSFVPEFDDLTFENNPPTDYPTGVLDPCGTATFPLTDPIMDQLIGIPIQVYNAVPTACATVLPNKLADTDVLVVRHANTCVPGDTNCEIDVSGKLYFQVSNCETELDAGDTYALDPNTHLATQIDCTTLERKRKFLQNIYYIRDYADISDDGIPTLMRSEFDFVGGTLAQQPAVPLVEGIERFRVELGIDNKSDSGLDVDPNSPIVWANAENKTSPINRGDGIPDDFPTAGERFIHCGAGCSVGQLANTVAVKLYILARADIATPGYTDTKDYKLGSPAAIGPFGDSFKRHVFSTTVRLHNIAGRRETP
jgi:type IV pilus assembly protein PilW